MLTLASDGLGPTQESVQQFSRKPLGLKPWAEWSVAGLAIDQLTLGFLEHGEQRVVVEIGVLRCQLDRTEIGIDADVLAWSTGRRGFLAGGVKTGSHQTLSFRDGQMLTLDSFG